MTGNNWQTPEYILDYVRKVGSIELDPCTTADNPVGATRYFTAEDNGLNRRWGKGLVFVNPPYGRGHMWDWSIRMVSATGAENTEIIALMRGDTSTKWARLLLKECDAVCFPPRIKFKGAKGSPNFSNIIYYFGRYRETPLRFVQAFESLGPIFYRRP